MIKMNILELILFMLTLFPMACSAENKIVLEQKDIQFFKAEAIRNQKSITLKVSGLAFHSSLAVSNIKTEQQADSLHVTIFLTTAREGLSGSFNYEITVPDSVSNVRFGNEKTLIWERNKN